MKTVTAGALDQTSYRQHAFCSHFCAFSTLSTTQAAVPIRVERTYSVKDAKASQDLFTAFEKNDIDNVLLILSRTAAEGGLTPAALTTPSLMVKHKLRTPLMAAAVTREFSVFTAFLDAFDRNHSNKVKERVNVNATMHVLYSDR